MVPTGDDFIKWLDEAWLQADLAVELLLGGEHLVSGTDSTDERPA